MTCNKGPWNRTRDVAKGPFKPMTSCLCMISPFIHTCSTYILLDNTRAYLSTLQESFMAILSILAVITTVYPPHIWNTRCSPGSPLHELPLAAHRLQKMVIRLVEKLHTADNPTEIAHGFPVPKVENKHTPVEYLMKGPENIPHTEVHTQVSFKLK